MTQHWRTASKRVTNSRNGGPANPLAAVSRTGRKAYLGGLGALALAGLGWALYAPPGSRTSVRGGGVTGDASPTGVANAVAGLPPPDLVRHLTPEEATKQNTARPFVNR